MAPRRPLLAGNWKMNGTRASLAEIGALCAAVAAGRTRGVDVMICPPATLVMAAADLCKGASLAIGGQDCAVEPRGAETGDLSAEMLGDAGAEAVIVGHSERRRRHGESDAVVRAKAEAARRAGLLAIICVGETRTEHEDGDTLAVILRQVEGSVPAGATAATVALAYEPIWAIGTGIVPTTDAIASVHGDIRERLRRLIGAEADGMRILYGGSVKPDNAASLSGTRDVDGVLVGGASLKAADFLGIADAYR